jgi:adenylate cyclase
MLRSKDASYYEAIDVLDRARTAIQKHNLFTAALAAVIADLAIDAARNGQRDNAIGELRQCFSLHTTQGFRVLAGRAGEVLVGLLLDRGSDDDLAEAHRVVDQQPARHPGVPAMDLWWLRSRALLAKAEGDSDGHVELAEQYLALCERLDARGRLGEAREMVATSSARPREV